MHRIVIASHKCPRHRDHRERDLPAPYLNLLPPPPLMEAEQFRRSILGKDAEKRWISSTTPQTDRPAHTILARLHCVVTSPRCRKENSFCWAFCCFIYTALFRGPFFLYTVLFVLVLNADWRLEKAFNNRVRERSTFTISLIWDLFNIKKKKKDLNTGIFIIHFLARNNLNISYLIFIK